MARQIAKCHPEREHCAHGLCKPCYGKQYKKARRSVRFDCRDTPAPTANKGLTHKARPLIDLDLGHKFQWGYRWVWFPIEEVWDDD